MDSERPSWAPDTIDLERPNAARIYDFLLGGAANFKQDRDFGAKLLEVMPEARFAARLNRAFLRRAVRFCVDAGIRQFLDIGSGIPTAGNVHEIAQSMAPQCRVLYVDNEPVAVTHGELMLRDNDRADSMVGDLADPDAILAAPPAGELLDLTEPIAVLVVAVLHFVPDSVRPYQAIARLVDAMAPGSYLVLSHAVIDPPITGGMQAGELYETSSTPGVGRPRTDIERFFAGTELVEPGLVWTPEWRPESRDEIGPNPGESLIVAGVGRKPAAG